MTTSGRIALVLGGGGLVGHAWHLGVLAGLADATGWDARSSALIVGTSAGAVVGAELRAGLHPVELLRPGTGAGPVVVPELALHPRTRRPAAPVMAGRAIVARAPAGLVLAGLLPRGRRDPGLISDAVAGLFPLGAGWPAGLGVCTVRLADGRRVVFGDDGRALDGAAPGGDLAADPTPDLGTVVAASCAMGGFFRPVTIAGADYVDGGSASVSNADVVAGAAVDLVVVSSPMSLDRAALDRLDGRRVDRGVRSGATTLRRRLQRQHRLVHTRRLARELAEVRRSGLPAVALEPGPDDLTVMGGITASMDFERRVAVADQARATAARLVRSPALDQARARLEASARPG